MDQNNQEYRLKYWATRSSVRSFSCFRLLASLAPSAALSCSLARSLRSLLRSWELLMSQNDLVFSHSDLVVWWTGCAIIIKEKKIQNETKKAKNLREEKWMGWQRLPRSWGVKVNGGQQTKDEMETCLLGKTKAHELHCWWISWLVGGL